MKNTYRITIMNSKNAQVAFRISAATLAAAVAAAQNEAGVPSSVEPTSTSNEGPIDIEA